MLRQPKRRCPPAKFCWASPTARRNGSARSILVAFSLPVQAGPAGSRPTLVSSRASAAQSDPSIRRSAKLLDETLRGLALLLELLPLCTAANALGKHVEQAYRLLFLRRIHHSIRATKIERNLWMLVPCNFLGTLHCGNHSGLVSLG